MPSLTAKEQIFCLEYIQDLNGARAQRASGLSTSAENLLMRPSIHAEVERLLQERAEALGISADTVVRELLANARAAREAKDFRASNEALKIVGDHLGMFKTNAGKGGVSFNFALPGPTAKAFENPGVIQTEAVDIPVDGELRFEDDKEDG